MSLAPLFAENPCIRLLTRPRERYHSSETATAVPI